MPAKSATPSMLAKGIDPEAGAFTDKDGRTTYLPAYDAEGKHWTTQYIGEDATKRFAKDSRKEGCCHVVGGLEKRATAPAIVIAEGYATAASLKQSLGFVTVAAFDAGNLAAVADALHARFLDKPIVIPGDNDRHLELTQGVSQGRAKAEAAAKLVGGSLMLPIFAAGENSFPAELAPVTPKLFREHEASGVALGEEQLSALGWMKASTDFNDLASRSEVGSDGLNRQVRSMVSLAVQVLQPAIVEQLQPESAWSASVSYDQRGGSEMTRSRPAARIR